MPVIERSIGGRSCFVLTSNLGSPCFITQPNPFLAFHDPQLTDNSMIICVSRNQRFPIFAQDHIRKLEGVFDKPYLLVDLTNPVWSLPFPLLMAAIIRLDQCRARRIMKAGAIDRTVLSR